MQLCRIDRTWYCKAPSAADIARAERLKRDREEKARQEQLAAERRKADIAQETARLGAHRTLEAERLVSLREAAERARRGNLPTPPPQACTNENVSGRIIACGIGAVDCHVHYQRTEQAARDSVATAAGNFCRNATGNAGHALSGMRCESGNVGLTRMHRCTAAYSCSAQKRICPSGVTGSAQ